VKLLRWHRGPRTVKLGLHCTACGHSFKRKVRKLLVDLNTMERNRGEPQGRSEYIIPERIVCPRCQAVDQFELASSSQVRIQMTILSRILVKPDPDDPVQAFRFALGDGTLMHPLDALEMYADQVARQPDHADLRVRYGNTLRALGYREEAEAQYHAALDREPTEIEALLNLAALHAAHRESQAAYDYLRRLIKCAPRSQHPQRDEFVEGAQLVLDGRIKLEEFDMTTPGRVLSAPVSPPRPVPRQPHPRRRKTRRKRKR